MNYESEDIVMFSSSQIFFQQTNTIYQNQKQRILSVFSNVTIDHIGSTAVPHALTKGDVDIQVRVTQEIFSEIRSWFAQQFLKNNETEWSNTYASFKNDTDFDLPLGIQLTVLNSEYDNFFQQQQKMLEDKEILQRYNTLKQNFQGRKMNEYRKAKSEFWESLTKRISD